MTKNIYTINQREIETNHLGVNELMKFYAYARKFRYTSVELNISPVNSMDANLSALLLAISYKLKVENKVNVFILLADNMSVFWRNGLVAHLQGKGNNNPYTDDRESTIPLTTFTVDEDENFCTYLKRDFLGHRGLYNVHSSIKKNLRNHYEEIFVNVVQHANTTYPIFTCGQYFPQKNQLKFTLVDLGEGFLKKINKKTGGEIDTDNSAIIWATTKLNTTKDIKIYGPGGTGLKEIKKYCDENNGSLHICSGAGYTNFIKDRTLENKLLNPLPGSLVNLIFRKI